MRSFKRILGIILFSILYPNLVLAAAVANPEGLKMGEVTVQSPFRAAHLQFNKWEERKEDGDDVTDQEIAFGSVEHVNNLKARISDISSDVRRKACTEAKELIFARVLHHSQIIYLYEQVILHSPDPLVRFERLDEVRYYYVDLLRDEGYAFDLSTLQFLKRLAENPKNDIYQSSFQALLTYITRRDPNYFRCRLRCVQKSINEIMQNDESPQKLETILWFEEWKQKYKVTQEFINNACLKLVRNERYISLAQLNYLPDYLEHETDHEANRNLLLLSNFLHEWYSVQDEDGDFGVLLHEEDKDDGSRVIPPEEN